MSGSKILYGSTGSKTVTYDQIITNTLLLKRATTGTFNIDGILNVSSITNLQDKVYITGNVYIGNIGGNVGIQDFDHILNVNSESFFIGDTNLVGNNYVVGNATLSSYVYYDRDQTHYLYGSPIGIGLNTISPQSTFDICGNIITALNVKTNLPQTRNNIVRNMNNKGISVYADNGKTSVCFVNDSSLNTTTSTNVGDGRITYSSGYSLQLDISNNLNRLQLTPSNTNLFSTVSMTSRPNDVTSHVNNEQLVIYDISNGSYQYPVYANTKITTGSALSIISNDNSSNTFLYATAPNRIGAGYGGGPYPMDTTRSMSTIGWTDMSGNYTPTIHIVSNKDPVKYHSTLGINTFKPRINQYSLDVNGPTHLDNSEITMILDVSFEINIASSSIRVPRYISVQNTSTYYGRLIDYNGTTNGSANSYFPNPLLVNTSILEASLIPTSSDAGTTWIYRNSSLYNITPGGLYSEEQYEEINVKSIYVYDTSYTFMGLSSGGINYTYNGVNWVRPNIYTQYPIFNSQPYNNIYVTFDSTYCHFYYVQSSGFGKIDMNVNSINSNIVNTFYNQSLYTTIQYPDLSNCTGIDGDISNTRIFISTQQHVYKYNSLNNSFVSVCDGSYNCIKCFDANHVIACGSKIVSYTSDGVTWNSTTIPNVNLNSVYIYDISSAIAVGTGLNGNNPGQIWITRNGYNKWMPIPDNILNTSGKSAVLYNCSNLKSVTMTDLNTAIITNVIRPFVSSVITNSSIESEQLAIRNRGYSQIYNCYLPNLFNRANNGILDICGNMTIAGDIHVDDEGEIITNNQTFNIINRNASNLNLAGDATNIIIGNSYFGNTYIRHNLDISLNAKIHSRVESGNIFTGSTVISGGVGIFANTNIGGNVRVNSVVESFTKNDGAVAIAGGMGIFANTNIGGNLRVNSVVESGNIFTGSAVISGGVGIFANTNIGGNVRVNSVVESGNILSGAVVISGGVGIFANTNIGGNVRVNSVVESFTKNDGAVAIAGGVGIFANTNIGGNLCVNSVVESNSKLSGAVVISGGVGVYANLYVGGNINVPTIQTNTINASPPINGNLYIGKTSNTIYIANAQSNVISSIVNLGGTCDITNIVGNLVITGNLIQKNPTLLTSPYILLNALNTKGSSIGSSANSYLDGAGIFIYDEGTPLPVKTSNASGFIKLASDSFGYIFQGTAVVNNAGTYTYYPNPVKLNLRSISMSMGATPYYGNIMANTLVSSNSNKNSILVLQDSVVNPATGAFDCSYQIVSSQFDLSSIVQRNVINSNVSVQEINTNLTIMGTTLINKGAQYGSGVLNAMMDVSGNVIVSKLGIGTNYVNGNTASLDIAGNLYQMVGGYIIQF